MHTALLSNARALYFHFSNQYNSMPRPQGIRKAKAKAKQALCSNIEDAPALDYVRPLHTTKAKGLQSPFLDEFMRDVCTGPLELNHMVTNAELFTAYTEYVERRTSNEEVRVAATQRRFAKQFNAVAREKEWRKVHWHAKGYLMRLRYAPARGKEYSTGKSKGEIAEAFLSNTATKLKVEVLPVPIKGHGVYTRESLAPKEAVCEYEGEEVPAAEAELRERQYADSKLEPRTIQMPRFRTALDGYKKVSGECFADIKQNIGSMLNHSRLQPNCEIVRLQHTGRSRVVVMTTVAVAAGQELTWDYAPDDKGDSWPAWFTTT